jgi:glutamate 5-kinase
MITKVLAAKKTMSSGIPTLLINGHDDSVLERVAAGETVGTLFWSGRGRIRDRKHWIAHTLKARGRLVVDPGAVRALVEGGKSLLPAGVLGVEGVFEFGNAVSVVDEASREIARGLVNYSTGDLERIKGLKTSEVRKLVGDNYYEEVIHRDDLVIFENEV